jgi:hypothetical protein
MEPSIPKPIIHCPNYCAPLVNFQKYINIISNYSFNYVVSCLGFFFSPTLNLTNFAHFLKNSPIFLCDQIGKENLGC